jgi:hypothetical protein
MLKIGVFTLEIDTFTLEIHTFALEMRAWTLETGTFAPEIRLSNLLKGSDTGLAGATFLSCRKFFHISRTITPLSHIPVACCARMGRVTFPVSRGAVIVVYACLIARSRV